MRPPVTTQRTNTARPTPMTTSAYTPLVFVSQSDPDPLKSNPRTTSRPNQKSQPAGVCGSLPAITTAKCRLADAERILSRQRQVCANLAFVGARQGLLYSLPD